MLEFIEKLHAESQARNDQRKVTFHDELIDKARDPARQVRRGGEAVEVPGIRLFGCSVWLRR